MFVILDVPYKILSRHNVLGLSSLTKSFYFLNDTTLFKFKSYRGRVLLLIVVNYMIITRDDF